MSEMLKPGADEIQQNTEEFEKTQQILDNVYELMREEGLGNVRATRFIVASESFDLSLMDDEEFVSSITGKYS